MDPLWAMAITAGAWFAEAYIWVAVSDDTRVVDEPTHWSRCRADRSLKGSLLWLADQSAVVLHDHLRNCILTDNSTSRNAVLGWGIDT
jgi:hypothetical protein